MRARAAGDSNAVSRAMPRSREGSVRADTVLQGRGQQHYQPRKSPQLSPFVVVARRGASAEAQRQGAVSEA